MKNFDSPYFASTLSSFWKQWHISLSTWFKDYVYIPLGGNRVVKWKSYYNLLITFLLSGFWHGANWTFVIWGAIHGVGIVLERGGSSVINIRLPKVVGWVLTIIVVMSSWVFFRANSLGDAILVFSKVFSFQFDGFYHSLKGVGVNKFDFLLSPIFIGLLLLLESINKFNVNFLRRESKSITGFVFFVFLLFMILIFGIEESNQFIYFQF